MSETNAPLKEIRQKKESIEKVRFKLSQLVGRDLGGIWRAANMPTLGFGNVQSMISAAGPNRGKPRDIHEFHLHIQCGWRFSRNGSLLFGAFDYMTEPNVNSTSGDVGATLETLLDVRLNGFRNAGVMPLKVRSIAVDSFLGFRISFSKGYRLDVLPMESDCDESSEYWRLLTRGRKYHLVASGCGLST